MAPRSAHRTARGFRPSDLLLLPEQERHLLTWLLRRGLVSLDDIIRELESSPVVARNLVDSLTQRGLLVRNNHQDVERYQAALGGNNRSARPETSPQKVGGMDRSDEETPD